MAAWPTVCCIVCIHVAHSFLCRYDLPSAGLQRVQWMWVLGLAIGCFMVPSILWQMGKKDELVEKAQRQREEAEAAARKVAAVRWYGVEAFCPKAMGVGLEYPGVARNKSAWSMKKSYLATCDHVVMNVFMNLQAKFKFHEIKSNPLSKYLPRQARLEAMRQKQEELKKAPSLVNLSCNRRFQFQTNLWWRLSSWKLTCSSALFDESSPVSFVQTNLHCSAVQRKAEEEKKKRLEEVEDIT